MSRYVLLSADEFLALDAIILDGPTGNGVIAGLR